MLFLFFLFLFCSFWVSGPLFENLPSISILIAQCQKNPLIYKGEIYFDRTWYECELNSTNHNLIGESRRLRSMDVVYCILYIVYCTLYALRTFGRLFSAICIGIWGDRGTAKINLPWGLTALRVDIDPLFFLKKWRKTGAEYEEPPSWYVGNVLLFATDRPGLST